MHHVVLAPDVRELDKGPELIPFWNSRTTGSDWDHQHSVARRVHWTVIRASRISFGGTAAIVTSMALIAGLEAANAGRPGVVSALLIAAVADNLSDSLSVHMYQESERFEQKDAFIGTLTNFGTRFVVCLSFVLIVVGLPSHVAVVCGLIWGTLLLAILTCILARHRRVSAVSEMVKHLSVAGLVITVSRVVGQWIAAHVF